MIDCHAHVYPHLWEYVGLPAAAGQGSRRADWAHRVLEQAESGVRRGQRALARRAGGPALTIEGSARLRREGSWLRRLAGEVLLNANGFPLLLFEGTTSGLEESMARSGVRRVVVIAAPPLATNEWLLALARRQPEPGRLIPVAMAPEPVEGEEEWLAALEALADGGARGFKIHPNMEGLPPSHGLYRAMFQVAEARHLFVILHTGQFWAVAYKHQRRSDAREFEDLFRSFPAVKVCLAHLNRDEPQQLWDLMRRYDQLYADTSWQSAAGTGATRHAVGAERLLLGSDWPFLAAEMQCEAVALLAEAVSADDFDRVTTWNAMEFLGEADPA